MSVTCDHLYKRVCTLCSELTWPEGSGKTRNDGNGNGNGNGNENGNGNGNGNGCKLTFVVP